VLRDLVPAFDLVFTYGGGPPVIERYTSRGAQRCVPIYNAHDPDTHHPVEPAARFRGDLAFMGNRLPDREARVDAFFFRAAELLPDRNFLIGGSGWDDRPMPANVTYLGHVYTDDHNAMNATPLTVLNISRQSMADTGYSPATRVFEAAAAGACLITDAWTGLDQFLAPGSEVLAAADGDGVAHHLQTLTPERAQAIGRAAHERVLRNHTYASRAAEVEAVLRNS
jgi:spore maturation protein CgeB